MMVVKIVVVFPMHSYVFFIDEFHGATLFDRCAPQGNWSAWRKPWYLALVTGQTAQGRFSFVNTPLIGVI